MELEPEEGELSASENEEVEEDGEGEPSAPMSTAVAERVDEATRDSVLSTLQQQLERDLSWPCENQDQRKREGEKGEDDEEDRVSPEKLQELGSSEVLHQMLANRHLRQLLVEIDSSANRQQAVQRAMDIPVFVEFADECLRVCGLRDNDDIG